MTKLKRRNFIKTLSGTSLLTLTGSNVLAGHSEEAFLLLTKPYLQHPSEDGMTICWLTNKPAHSWVVYWELGQSDKKTKKQTLVDGLAIANNTVNKIRLTGLKAGQQYSYQVYSKEIIDFQAYKKVFGPTLQSEVFNFSTVASEKEEMAMLILNDIHDRPHSFAALIGLHRDRPYDEVFLNGDMFDYQDGEQQLIDHLITPCTALFASAKPFLFVRGNHETRGHFAYHLNDYFENIDKQAYFTFTRGPVFFAALDTGEDKEDDHEAYYGMAAFDPFREEQAAWLARALQTPAARQAHYRVILMHIPPYHSGDWHGTSHCRQVFSPVFEKHQVDLVISGHTHRYGVHLAQPDHSYPIVIGGGPKEGTRTAIHLTANKEHLQLSMVADNGQEVGQLALKPRQG